MRFAIALLLLTGTAAAQPYQQPYPPAYPQATPPAYPQPPAPAYAQPAPPPSYAQPAAPPAYAQPASPAYAQPAPPAYPSPAQPAYAPYSQSDTGARPGNDIGTGMSLPRSNNAGNINAATTHSDLAPNLPAPVGVESVHDLLLTARQALAANQTGAAQEALERAESRALDRDVTPGTERIPDQSPEITAIAQARDALANNNLSGAIAIVDAALRR